MSRTDPSCDVHLRETIQKSAEELSLLLDLIEPVEIALENISTKADRAVLQNIDLVGQTIQALSGFLSNVAVQISEETQVDVGPALASVSLEATRRRLTIHDEPSVAQNADHISLPGVPNLF